MLVAHLGWVLRFRMFHPPVGQQVAAVTVHRLGELPKSESTMVTLYIHILSCRWDSTQAFTFLDVVKPVHIPGHSCDGWYLFLHSHSFDGIPQHLVAMEIISKNILVYSLFFSLFCNNHPKASVAPRRILHNFLHT